MNDIYGNQLQINIWYWIKDKKSGKLRVRQIKEINPSFIEVTENSSVNFFDDGLYDFCPTEEPNELKSDR